jgi:hypothetical protein
MKIPLVGLDSLATSRNSAVLQSAAEAPQIP